MIELDVIGLPAPKGSKTAFLVGKKGGPQRAIVTDASNKSGRDRLSPWNLAVTAAIQRALAEIPGYVPIDGPLLVVACFYLPRPASTPRRVQYPAKKPDLDKLVRAAADLCSKVVWTDDSRIVTCVSRKRFAVGRPPGMTLRVSLES